MSSPRRQAASLGLFTTLLVAACTGGPGLTPGPVTSGPGGPVSSAGGAPDATLPPGGPDATQGPGGGGARSPAPGVTDEACTMLSAADVEALIGGSLVTAVPAQQLGIFTNGCLFEISLGGTTTSINLGVMTQGGRAYYDSEIKPSNAQNGYSPIQGLGEEAVSARAGSVMAVAGDALVYVQYFGPTGPDQAVSTEVVRKVLSNLGL